VKIAPKLRVTNGQALDESVNVVASLKRVTGRKGRYEALVLVIRPGQASAPASARASRPAGQLFVQLDSGVPAAKLRPGEAGFDSAALRDVYFNQLLPWACAVKELRDFVRWSGLFGAAVELVERFFAEIACSEEPAFALLLFAHLVSNVYGPLLGVEHMLGDSLLFAYQLVAAGFLADLILVGPLVATESFRSLTFTDDPMRHTPLQLTEVCTQTRINRFGTYMATLDQRGFGAMVRTSGELAVGPAPKPLAQCELGAGGPAPELKVSWCTFGPSALGTYGKLFAAIDGLPGQRVEVEVEGPEGTRPVVGMTTLPPEGATWAFTSFDRPGPTRIHVRWGESELDSLTRDVDTSQVSPTPAPEGGCVDQVM
jgi:hypothetical protein